MIRQTGRPFPARFLYPDALFRIAGCGKKLFLTFDDGPEPSSTPLLLDVLNSLKVPATFFCTGSKVAGNPGLLARIVTGGHVIGNHGYSHLNGLTTSLRNYCADIYRGRDVTCSNLFRPPYGRLGLRQYKMLERSMKIVFWDVMPYDFDPHMPSRACLAILRRNSKPGSIIVLHDSAKSSVHLFLEDFIRSSHDAGYSFATLEENYLLT